MISLHDLSSYIQYLFDKTKIPI